jgi:hypothetical protein
MFYRHANPDMAPTIKDLPIGKIRIRLSTLESDRVYTNAYPLLVVTPQGVKKMGELELAVRLSSALKLNLMHAYLQPPLPRMHYFYPLDHKHAESLRVAAMNMVALRLMRSEPALRQEVVQFMLDTDAERWSMRRSKANYYRIMVIPKTLNPLVGNDTSFVGKIYIPVPSKDLPASLMKENVIFLSKNYGLSAHVAGCAQWCDDNNKFIR